MADFTNKNTPLWDRHLPLEERIDWLLRHMTIEEKLDSLTSRGGESKAAGVPLTGLGGEAAHGVQGRNDQGIVSAPDLTTSFPQPIGMSATWDPEILKEAGRVVGIEARVVDKRKPVPGGLCRWAPTIDLERDPRWGRNEEAYGEDATLTGEMASAYVRGMRGDHPFYIRCASMLKHFYANNTEDGRGWKNATITPRNRYELYLEPFRRAIENGGAMGVMTAYNKINGIPGILNPEVKNILKKQYGMTYAVGDGGAMSLVKNVHHYYGNHYDTIAAALKAGVDGMLDGPVVVRKAAKDAYELGILTEEQIDEAIRAAMRVKIRLGYYDREPGNPYADYTEDDINSEAHQEISRQVARESVVLLKNDGGILPLSADERPALIGPIADVWYQDWYGGEPIRKTTLQDGLKTVTGEDFPAVEGYDRIVLKLDGKAVSMDDDGTLRLGGKPEEFYLMDWGSGNFTIKSVRTGLFWQTCIPSNSGQQLNAGEPGAVVCTRTAPFDWFVMERFFLEENADGTTTLISRFRVPVGVAEDGRLRADLADMGNPAAKGAHFTVEITEDGAAAAAEAAKKAGKVILAVGCSPMINAKEEIDRSTLALPPQQEKLIRSVFAANPNTILVMFCNYPYTMNGLEKELPAVVWSATGSQDMGEAMAEVLYGKYAPAGRLNMTWYASDDQLPSIDDYDIIKGKRTYRYFDGEVMYPFGFGLTYTDFRYENLSVVPEDTTRFRVEFDITNTGSAASDEVAQVYGTAPASRVPKPLKQLLAFRRVKNVAPGETRHVCLCFNTQEFRFYDTIGGKLMVEEGDYAVFAGRSSADCALSTVIHVHGEHTGLRDFAARIPADHFDEYENLELTKGEYGFTAARPLDPDKPLVLTYRDGKLEEGTNEARILLTADTPVTLEILADGKEIGRFEDSTSTYVESARFRENSLNEGTPRPTSWPAVYTDVLVPLHDVPGPDTVTSVTLKLTGPAKILSLRLRKKPEEGGLFG